MKQLDEAGIPIPLSERLWKYIGDVEDRVDALAAIKALPFDRISEFDEIDLFIISQSL
ncbi:hypothetical protein [Methylobacterium sp. J-070]|uniref:hypothetical protein n=1 Tax=Methylobacterium sp. J-070 TaxID=2836650 RepID=UPI001FB88BA2|nr:hypothetical protein [Methylobacterium sp. J-070]MCJ2052865.1 hypothetical protein [Methylobacterium sp. J-070]